MKNKSWFKSGRSFFGEIYYSFKFGILFILSGRIFKNSLGCIDEFKLREKKQNDKENN